MRFDITQLRSLSPRTTNVLLLFRSSIMCLHTALWAVLLAVPTLCLTLSPSPIIPLPLSIFIQSFCIMGVAGIRSSNVNAANLSSGHQAPFLPFPFPA